MFFYISPTPRRRYRWWMSMFDRTWERYGKLSLSSIVTGELSDWSIRHHMEKVNTLGYLNLNGLITHSELYIV